MTTKEKKLPDDVLKSDTEEIRENRYSDEGESAIGENRGQLFVRIPKFVTKRLKLEKGQKMIFRVYADNKIQKLEIGVKK